MKLQKRGNLPQKYPAGTVVKFDRYPKNDSIIEPQISEIETIDYLEVVEEDSGVDLGKEIKTLVYRVPGFVALSVFWFISAFFIIAVHCANGFFLWLSSPAEPPKKKYKEQTPGTGPGITINGDNNIVNVTINNY